jgi:hypothetical protein
MGGDPGGQSPIVDGDDLTKVVECLEDLAPAVRKSRDRVREPDYEFSIVSFL